MPEIGNRNRQEGNCEALLRRRILRIRVHCIMQAIQFSDMPRRAKLAIQRELAAEALRRYSVEVTTVRFYAEHSNLLYSAGDVSGNRYILKITRPGDHGIGELEESARWLMEVNRRHPGLLVDLVPATDGSLLVEVVHPELGEARYCALFRWVPGEVLYRRLSGPSARAWGSLVGSLHRISADLPGEPPGSALMTWDRVFYWDDEVLFDEKYADFIPGARAECFRRTADAVQSWMDRAYGCDRPILIHADLHPDNIKVTESGLIALDIEDLMRGMPGQDIGIALFYVRRRPDYPRIFDAFRRGYEEHLAFPAERPEDLHVHFAARQLMFANFILKLDDYSRDEKLQALSNYEQSFRKMGWG
jgi:Ser/Thr protein kinase RdoA (MazF antagonist)